MESPGTYPDAEPYEFGGVEQAEVMSASVIAPAATNARNLFIDASPCRLSPVEKSRCSLLPDHLSLEDIGALPSLR